MELLLLSNSRTANGFLVDYLAEIRDFAGNAPRRAAFVAFASVQRPWPEFTALVKEALSLDVRMVQGTNDLHDAELLLVGGGNTFQLLAECRARGLLTGIQDRVRKGMKYVGWSAGANLACPTIKTTNDMPIVDPGGLEALGLLPFQLNCHYTSQSIPGHQGETRDQRLAEFARLNPGLPVLALPEGDWLRVSGDGIELRGPHEAIWFHGEERLSVERGRVQVPRPHRPQ